MLTPLKFADDRPSSGMRPELADPSAGRRRRLEGRRILLVEDEALVAMELQMALEDDGAKVIGPVQRLESAVRVTETETFDGAILDVDLNGRDVFPAADVLRRRGVPFLFHTGHVSEHGLSERFPDAVVFSKPARADDIIESLLQLIGRH